MTPKTSRILVIVVTALAMLSLGAAPQGQAPAEVWPTFSGSWYATGTRQTVPTEGDRPAAVIRVEGTVVIEQGEALSKGFRGEAAYFHDGHGLGVGRAVWTDERGDRIFSELRGDAAEKGRRVNGKVIAGTGRYAKLEGEFSMTWQFVVATEGGTIQGRSPDLQGKFRFVGAPK